MPYLARLAAALLLAVGIGLLSAGCQQQRAAPPAPPPPAVSVASPVPYPVQKYLEYNGHLESMETVRIVARVKGFLDKVAFKDKEGTEVKKGTLLYEIDPRTFKAEVERGSAEVDRLASLLDQATEESARARRLRASRAISEEELMTRTTGRRSAEAAMVQAKASLTLAKLDLGFTKITAPIDGQISRTLVTEGNMVGQDGNTLLTTIVSMDPLYVYFDVPERDLADYQQGLRTKVLPDPTSQKMPLEVGVTNEQGHPHAGTLDFRENRVDIGTGTVRMRGRVPNPKVPPGNARLLYPGMYARVRVPSGKPKTMLAIPEDALMTGQEGHYVYVLGEGDVVRKKTVVVGPSVWKAPPPNGKPAPGWSLVAAGAAGTAEPVPSVVAIESGLAQGDRLVINGLTKARPGAPVAPEPWELKAPPGAAAPK